MTDLDAVSIYVELSAAIGELQARGLQQSVKWAAEQLVGLPDHAFEAGAKQAAEATARAVQPEHPRLVQGRSYFELKVSSHTPTCTGTASRRVHGAVQRVVSLTRQGTSCCIQLLLDKHLHSMKQRVHIPRAAGRKTWLMPLCRAGLSAFSGVQQQPHARCACVRRLLQPLVSARVFPPFCAVAAGVPTGSACAGRA